MYTTVLSGPLAQRGPLLAALNQTGVNLDEPQPAANPSHNLPDGDPETGWVTCQHSDVDHVAAAAAQAGWQLRIHWPTPACPDCHDGTFNGQPCPRCAGTGHTNRRPRPDTVQPLAARLDEALARIAALEAKDHR